MPQTTNNFAEQAMRERLQVGWPWRLMVTMLVVFLASILVYLGLAYGYKPFLNKSLADIQGELDGFSAQLSSEQKENFVNFYSQITNLQRLLRTHVLGSKVFPLLESLTHKEVTYTTSNLSVSDKTVTLEGVARNYEVLVQQLALYQGSPEVTRVILDSAKSLGSVVQFRVKLILNPEVFKS